MKCGIPIVRIVIGIVFPLGLTGPAGCASQGVAGIFGEVIGRECRAGVTIVRPGDMQRIELASGGPEAGEEAAWVQALLLVDVLNGTTSCYQMEGEAPVEDCLLVIIEGRHQSAIIHVNGLGFTLGVGDTWIFTNRRLAADLREILQSAGEPIDRAMESALCRAAGDEPPHREPSDAESRQERILSRRASIGLTYKERTYSASASVYGDRSERDVLAEVDSLPSRKELDKAVDAEGSTRLHLAARAAYWSVVKQLLLLHASPNVKDENGRTPLHFAAGNDNHEIACLLLIAGADPNAKDVGLWTPLYRAMEFADETTPTRDIIRVLLAAGADANAQDMYGETALVMAVRAGRDDIVRMLLAGGADPELSNGEGMSPMKAASGKPVIENLLREAIQKSND